MRVPENLAASFPPATSSAAGRRLAPERVTPSDEAPELSIPVLKDLIEAGRPTRDSFLSSLKESVRSGKYSCSPGQVAADILTKGF